MIRLENLLFSLTIQSRKGFTTMSRLPFQIALFVGILSFLLVSGPSFGEGQSSRTSSTGLSSTQAGSAGSSYRTQSGTTNLDWLNKRLSEQRPSTIRSRLKKRGLSGVGTSTSGNSYLERRARLNKALATDPIDEEMGEDLQDDLLPTPAGLQSLTEEIDDTENPESSPSENRLKTRDDYRGVEKSMASPEGRRDRRALIDDSVPQSEFLSTEEAMSDTLGTKPFERVDENGEVIDERLEPLVDAEAEEAMEEEEELPVLLPSQITPSAGVEESQLPVRIVRPAVPAPAPSQYQIQNEVEWNRVPVREPLQSQFGTGVNRSTVPFERSRVRNPGVYSGYQYHRPAGVNTDSSYQYRGPRLYSIGESEYDSNTDYQSLPYYRR